MTAVIIELDPPTGITGFPFGMAAEQVKQAAAALGKITVKDEGLAQEWAHMTIDVAPPRSTSPSIWRTAEP